MFLCMFDNKQSKLVSLISGEDVGGCPNVCDKRPDWSLFGKVNQNMETILFREKFADWPDNSRFIKVKSQEEVNSTKVTFYLFLFNECFSEYYENIESTSLYTSQIFILNCFKSKCDLIRRKWNFIFFDVMKLETYKNWPIFLVKYMPSTYNLYWYQSNSKCFKIFTNSYVTVYSLTLLTSKLMMPSWWFP